MSDPACAVPLTTIAREWLRIGVTGFGGPPTHIVLLRRLCVSDRRWIGEAEFEDTIAAVNLLPGPASTQLAIWCGWRLRGTVGALLAGFCFILPGLLMIIGLAAVFLAEHPPEIVLGAAAGAGSAVAAVALHAAWGLAPASWKRIQNSEDNASHIGDKVRWLFYAALGAVSAATIGPWLVLVLLACGLIEVSVRLRGLAVRSVLPLPLAQPLAQPLAHPLAFLASDSTGTGGLLALAFTAFKVGALSYGGGFVIIPLMQHDAVGTRHWMSSGQFLDAVALGQITPGPVVQTVAVVGYAAAGVGGALLAAAVAFAPSFVFVLAGARRFDRLRGNRTVQAFLTGAGPAVIGAIAGSAVPLAAALARPWQYVLLVLAAAWLLLLRRGVVSALLLSAACGAVVALSCP
ncbi:chromate efflux transporter [Catenulispora yoronensis]|uniref:Chromate efflux transporter n=1 Tax=Catenulispora yoronensis TaxID=450799 RepID=A0ABN2U843_9ACTN